MDDIKEQIKREKRAARNREYYDKHIRKHKPPKTEKQLAISEANKKQVQRRAKQLQALKDELEFYKQDIQKWKELVDKQSEIIFGLLLAKESGL